MPLGATLWIDWYDDLSTPYARARQRCRDVQSDTSFAYTFYWKKASDTEYGFTNRLRHASTRVARRDARPVAAPRVEDARAEPRQADSTGHGWT